MAKQVIRLNESDLARMIGEAVKELKKESKSYKRGDDKGDGHKTKMKPYKEPKYRDFNFEEDEDIETVSEGTNKNEVKESKKKLQLSDDMISEAIKHTIKEYIRKK